MNTQEKTALALTEAFTKQQGVTINKHHYKLHSGLLMREERDEMFVFHYIIGPQDTVLAKVNNILNNYPNAGYHTTVLVNKDYAGYRWIQINRFASCD